MKNNTITHNNHYVQKALQNNFSTCADKGNKIYYVNLKNEKGHIVDITRNMKSRNLYHDEIELLFIKIEKDFIELCNNLRCKKKVIIRRDQLDIIKKYFLLQLIRTPAEIKRIKNVLLEAGQQTYISECLSDCQEDELEEDYWFRILEVVLKNEWNDLQSCDCPFVKCLLLTLDRMNPLLIETKRDLILPDSGVSRYLEWYKPKSRYWGFELKEVFNKDYSAEESYSIAGNGGPILIFCCLPLDPNHALMLVDDVVRMRETAPRPMQMDFFPPLKYNTQIKYHKYRKSDKHIGIDEIKDVWTSQDEIILTKQFADSETTNKLNLLALNNSDEGFSFRTNNGIKEFLKEYLPEVIIEIDDTIEDKWAR